MDYYSGLLLAAWLGAASCTVWVYNVRGKQAAEKILHETEWSSRLSDAVGIAVKRAEDAEAKLYEIEKRAGAEVELQKEPVKKKKTWSAWKSKKHCEKKPKHKRSREWDD